MTYESKKKNLQKTIKQTINNQPDPPIEHSEFNPLEKPFDDCFSATPH